MTSLKSSPDEKVSETEDNHNSTFSGTVTLKCTQKAESVDCEFSVSVSVYSEGLTGSEPDFAPWCQALTATFKVLLDFAPWCQALRATFKVLTSRLSDFELPGRAVSRIDFDSFLIKKTNHDRNTARRWSTEKKKKKKKKMVSTSVIYLRSTST